MRLQKAPRTLGPKRAPTPFIWAGLSFVRTVPGGAAAVCGQSYLYLVVGFSAYQYDYDTMIFTILQLIPLPSDSLMVLSIQSEHIRAP